MYFQVRR